VHSLQLYVPALKAALQCASTDETRYYLNGVFVVASAIETTYVATDGHILLAYRRDTQSTDDLVGCWIISADIIAKLKLPSRKAAKRPAYEYVTLTDSGDGYLNLATCEETSTTFKPIRRDFPRLAARCPGLRGSR
jgi:DNA polymerase III sliding clamp (beta) subunit (PCNA family)